MKGCSEKMVDLREHKEIIKTTVKKVSDNDKYWKWKTKSISKSKVFINWAYLDYCEESYPKNCFTIESP